MAQRPWRFILTLVLSLALLPVLGAKPRIQAQQTAAETLAHFTRVAELVSPSVVSLKSLQGSGTGQSRALAAAASLTAPAPPDAAG